VNIGFVFLLAYLLSKITYQIIYFDKNISK